MVKGEPDDLLLKRSQAANDLVDFRLVGSLVQFVVNLILNVVMVAFVIGRGMEVVAFSRSLTVPDSVDGFAVGEGHDPAGCRSAGAVEVRGPGPDLDKYFLGHLLGLCGVSQYSMSQSENARSEHLVELGETDRVFIGDKFQQAFGRYLDLQSC